MTNTQPTVGSTAPSSVEDRRSRIREEHLRPVGQRPVSSARGLHHTALISSDVETTIRFYQDLLGFPLVELVENRDYPGSSHFFFDLGNQTLLGFFDFPGLGLDPGVESIGSVQHIAISSPRDRWEQVRERLDAAGVEYAGPDRGIEESMYFKDPDGIQIELLSDPLMYFGGRQLDE
jgi:glyoxylase I family protein